LLTNYDKTVLRNKTLFFIILGKQNSSVLQISGTTKFMLLDSIANGIIAESAEKILKGSLIEVNSNS